MLLHPPPPPTVFAKPFAGALDAHSDGVYALAKHPHSLTTIVSGAGDGEIRVWCVETLPRTITLHCTAPHCTVLHCTALHRTTLYCTTLCCTALHRTTLYCTTLHCTVLHCTELCCTPRHHLHSFIGSGPMFQCSHYSMRLGSEDRACVAASGAMALLSVPCASATATHPLLGCWGRKSL
jgi:hypothetical protein